jgi:hypothetical protein
MVTRPYKMYFAPCTANEQSTQSGLAIGASFSPGAMSSAQHPFRLPVHLVYECLWPSPTLIVIPFP